VPVSDGFIPTVTTAGYGVTNKVQIVLYKVSLERGFWETPFAQCEDKWVVDKTFPSVSDIWAAQDVFYKVIPVRGCQPLSGLRILTHFAGSFKLTLRTEVKI